MATSQLPSQLSQPAYGRRTLPTLVDDFAKYDPSKLYTSYPTGSDFSSPLRRVTYSDLSRAVNRAAWWIEKTLGGKGNFKTIAYMGPQDIRYWIITLAASKTQYKLLLPSTRNSVAFHLHVLNKTSCDTFLRDSETSIDAIKVEQNLTDIVVPTLDEFLQEGDVEHYPFDKTFEEAAQDPFLILHSSGSTGPPKPITWLHGSGAKVDAHHLLPSLENSRPFLEVSAPGTPMFTPFPFFHTAGVLGCLLISIYWDRPTILPPPGARINSQTVYDAIEYTQVPSMMLAPSLLEEMVHTTPDELNKLDNLECIWFGGGSCAPAIGEEIRKHTPVYSVIGTTENGFFPALTRDPEDWIYFNFPPMKGMEFRDVGDDLYEMVIVRDPETDKFHSTWESFPDLQEYSTKDLYTKHPTKPHYWMHHGRSDDVLVLSNGEKVVPGPLQDVLKAAPEVKEILAIGHSRFEVAAIIELEPQVQDVPKREILNRLSPYLKRGNDLMPKFARLSKDRIIFAKPEKPFARAAKGTLVRKVILRDYQEEVDAVYAGTSEFESAKLPLLNNTTKEDTVHALLEMFNQITDIQNLTPEQDFFNSGFDSLGVMNIGRMVRAQLKSEGSTIPLDAVSPSLIYGNPTVNQLADALRSLSNRPTDPASLEKARLQAVEDMVAKYTKDLPTKKSKKPSKSSDLSVILTGSTGSLGSYLLDSLLSNPRISHVYALNRSADAGNRQAKASSSRGLSTSFNGRVTFLHADMSKSSLGLSPTDYETLKANTDIIIHNQWQVDFNLSLASFEPHIAGVRNLIDLALASPHNPYLIFTSSVSTVGSWAAAHPDSPKVPEVPIHDARSPFSMGYGESKHASERILDIAAQRTGLHTALARVGQIAGPVFKQGGVWNRQEWFPSLVASSAYLHLLPSALGLGGGAGDSQVDWMPVDILADVLVDVSLHDLATGPAANNAEVYNLANPRQSQWSTLVPAALAGLPADTQIVPYPAWVAALRHSSEAEHPDPVRNPALKLLEFFEGMAYGNDSEAAVLDMDIVNAVERSGSMRGMQAVGKEWMEGWMRAWGFGKRAD